MLKQGEAMRGTPKNALRFLGTPTRPYEVTERPRRRRVGAGLKPAPTNRERPFVGATHWVALAPPPHAETGRGNASPLRSYRTPASEGRRGGLQTHPYNCRSPGMALERMR